MMDTDHVKNHISITGFIQVKKDQLIGTAFVAAPAGRIVTIRHVANVAHTSGGKVEFKMKDHEATLASSVVKTPPALNPDVDVPDTYSENQRDIPVCVGSTHYQKAAQLTIG
jgi:hypothetical protein